MNASEAIKEFRAIETNEDAIPVLGDDDAMRVLAAWGKTDQRWAQPRRKMPAFTPTTHAAVWAWIVEGWDIDVDAVARTAGCSARVASAKLDMLVRNRLIYPDGAMSKGARTALTVYVASKIKAASGKKPKKNESGEGSETN